MFLSCPMLAADLPATGHSLPQLLRNHGYATGSDESSPRSNN